MNGNVKCVEKQGINSEYAYEMQICCYSNVKYFAIIKFHI
jgi:hypothetical protein